jgi:hypothetical protein
LSQLQKHQDETRRKTTCGILDFMRVTSKVRKFDIASPYQQDSSYSFSRVPLRSAFAMIAVEVRGPDVPTCKVRCRQCICLNQAMLLYLPVWYRRKLINLPTFHHLCLCSHHLASSGCCPDKSAGRRTSCGEDSSFSHPSKTANSLQERICLQEWPQVCCFMCGICVV